jgi:hypothetical protein
MMAVNKLCITPIYNLLYKRSWDIKGPPIFKFQVLDP